MIRIEELSKSFGEKKVLTNISFSVGVGERVFVMGRSGTGKSVLLKQLVGLMDPDAGSIWVDDFEVTALSEAELAPVRKKCGMVFQGPALMDSLSVYENIALGLRAHRVVTADKEEETIHEAIHAVGLKTDIAAKLPNELGYTVQKRVAIARAVALGPDYLLFDEPTTGMDPVVTSQLNGLMLDLSERRKITLLVVSHDVKSALSVASRVLLLEAGKIVYDGPASGFRNSEVPLARAFVREVE